MAHDTQSQVPREPVKQERAKKEPPPPKNAVELKSKTAKQLRAKVETQPQVRHFKSFDELDPNKIKSAAGARGLESACSPRWPGPGVSARGRTPRWVHASVHTRRRFRSWYSSIGGRAMSTPASVRHHKWS